MDQKRLFLAISLSIAILIGFQFLMPPPPKPVAPIASSETTPAPAATGTTGSVPGIGAPGVASPAAAPVPRNLPRVKFSAPRVEGSIALVGARLDTLVLRDYREAIGKDAANVRLLEPRGDKEPTFVQFGWTAAEGETAAMPGEDTLWTASGELGPGAPMTLSWANGAGVTFEIVFAIDENYMFTVEQRLRNAAAAPVRAYPWSRIRRDFTPVTAGYYILHEGMIGVLEGRLKETTYSDAKTDGQKSKGVALTQTATGGWAGITDKYWLTALIPDQGSRQVASFRYIAGAVEGYQVDFLAADAQTVAPGSAGAATSRLFAGAKEVHLLDRYERAAVPSFDKAVDFGWFYFLTKPIFYALDWLNALLHNFGLAIIVFTIFVKGLFFPLANKSYRSMSKMKLLAPKMTILREQHKDNQQELQKKMMELYKSEKVNPSSGCLPIIIQIPVFFSLYKVIFVTIEMRQAPFFGWIHDLSALDPTNIFNLVGLIPFDPTVLPGIGPFLQMGLWPLIMGVTMYLQMKLNPPPPDPVQARLFQLMPIIFTFMLASFPAGLVIYWSWNNLLTICQQWLIMRQTSLSKPGAAKG